jgi:hypothetical protein
MDACNRLLVILLVLLCSRAFGQHSLAVQLDQRIILPASALRLDSLLKTISKQTKFAFSYNTRKLNPALSISCPSKNSSLAGILASIKEKTGLDYLIADNLIILKQTSLIARPAISEGTIVQKRLISSDTNAVKLFEEGKKKIDPSVKDSPVQTEPIKLEKKESNLQSLLSESKIQLTQILPPTPPTSTYNQTKSPIKSKKKGDNGFFMQTGLSFDETTFIGLTTQIGKPMLYGTIAYKTDFTVALISYGVGTSVRVNKTRFNLFVNTGSLEKGFHLLTKPIGDTSRSILDTARINNIISVKSNLTRIGLTLERKIYNKVTLQVGMLYNFMNTSYFINGSASAIGFTGSDADKKFHTLTPPYLFHNSYSSNSYSNIKNWIGFQFNLMYSINFSRTR